MVALLAVGTATADEATTPPAETKAPEPPTTTRPDSGAPGASPERIDQLIRQLGDDRYEQREEAQAELAAIGFAAFEALRTASDDEDLEIATRAGYLLRLLSVDLTRPGDPADVAVLLRQFHVVEPAEQLARLQRLAQLPDGRGIAALCRVIRFEPSILLAKQAALAILRRYPTKQVPMARLAKLLRENLRDSRRLPSRWMLGCAKFHDAPDEGWRQWEKWLDDERELLRQEDQDTNSQIVWQLASLQVDWVAKLGGTSEQMTERIQRLLEIRRPDRGEDTKELVAWLVEQKAWEALDVPALVFAERLAADPRSLVYVVAGKYADAGKDDLAESAAAKAIQLGARSDRESQRVHLQAAQSLLIDGRFKWAEAEYRKVIGEGDLGDAYVRDAFEELSEMLHDQGENKQAADLMEQYLEALTKLSKQNRPGFDMAAVARLRSVLSARMDYFLACHWREAGNRDKERLALEAGLALNPEDPDLLIAAFNLPEADPLFRAKVRRLLAKVVLQMRRRYVVGSDRAVACNDLAWLIANTEGDVDEAIRLSKMSLRMQPNLGAYYDTLARCYYAKKDYENAVKYQIKACELDPKRGLIAKQLELFRRTYEEKLGKPAPKPKSPKKRDRTPQLMPAITEEVTFPFPEQ